MIPTTTRMIPTMSFFDAATGAGDAVPAMDRDAARETLLALNREYIRAVTMRDVARFRELLSEDFRCSLPDGTLIDKAAFLARTAKPLDISNLEVQDVDVRLLGDVAIVHARTTFTTRDGRSASGRYTDVWARRGLRWVAVSAHVTRC